MQQSPEIKFVMGGDAVERADAGVGLSAIAVLIAVEVAGAVLKHGRETLRRIERTEGVLDERELGTCCDRL